MHASRCPRAGLPSSFIPWVCGALWLACLAGTAAGRDLPVGSLSFPSPAGWTIQQSGQAWLMSPPGDGGFVAVLPGSVQARGYTLAEVADKTWEHVATTGGFQQISREKAVEGATGAGWPILLVAGQCRNGQGEAVLKAVVVIGAPSQFYPVYVDARDMAAMEKHLPAVILMIRNVQSTGEPAAPPAGPPTASGSARTAAPGANRGIVGKWSTLSWYGDYVDPGSGAFQGHASNGEWWEFRADGTWEFIMIAHGSFISGGTHPFGHVASGRQPARPGRQTRGVACRSRVPARRTTGRRTGSPDTKCSSAPNPRCGCGKLPNGEWGDWMNPR